MQQDEFQTIVLEKLNKIDKAIYGNGGPGLLTRVSLVEDGIRTHKKILWLVVGGLTTTTITLIVAAVAKHLFC